MSVLIIGTMPPPIGGVTIHTVRLIDLCNKEKINYSFYNLQKFNIISFFKALSKSKKSHLHASNPLLLFLHVFLCRVLKISSIITIHGDIEGHNIFLSFVEKCAIKLCNIPIVLNQNSFNKAIKINLKTRMISSFIPPLKKEKLTLENLNKIISFKENNDELFCTNAYDFTFDKNGNETYGILSLINYFNKFPKKKLIISDPKGSYFLYTKKYNIIVENNILFLTNNHSFFEVLKMSSCFIRNTSTDGDSLSIKEALYIGLPVLATDCVSRPKGVKLINYNDITSLDMAICGLNIKEINKKNRPVNGGLEILNLYKN
jgi:glycosyltransferase involved in cell wall biosynthesis